MPYRKSGCAFDCAIRCAINLPPCISYTPKILPPTRTRVRDSCRWYLNRDANLGNPRNPKIGYLESPRHAMSRTPVSRPLPHCQRATAGVSTPALFVYHSDPLFEGTLLPLRLSFAPLSMPINGGSGWLQSMISPERLAGHAKCKIPTSPGGAACRIERFGVQNAAFSVPELACF
jgi:hypothetical protein